MDCSARWLATFWIVQLLAVGLSVGVAAQIAAPANVTASDGRYPSRIEVSWSHVLGAKGYEVDRRVLPSVHWSKVGETTDPTYIDRTVTSCLAYEYRVRAWDGRNWSAYSDADSGYAKGEAPPAPADISVSVSETDEIIVTWTASAQATEYHVFRADAEQGPYTELGAATVPQFADDLPSPCVRYWYRVAACNACGCGLSSSPAVTWAGDIAFASATAMVINEILPKIIPPGVTFLCAKMDGALPAGARIEEDGSSGSLAKPSATVIGEDSYLFFLDLAPGMYYEHGVKYIVVSRCGVLQVIDAAWWPKVNGEVVEAFRDLTPDSQSVFAGRVTGDVWVRVGDETWSRIDDGPWVRVEGVSWTRVEDGVWTRVEDGAWSRIDDGSWTRVGDAAWASLDGLGHVSPEAREAFLVVQGVLPSESLFADATATGQNGAMLFESYASNASEVETLAGTDAARVLDEVHSLAEAGFSPITVYIIGHGGVGTVRLGGVQFTVHQLRDEVAEHSATLFNFLIGSCHSGSFVSELSDLANVLVVESACAADASASSDWDYYGELADYNVEDSGSEWTSSVLEATALIVRDHWPEVLAEAARQGVSATSVLVHAAGLAAIGQYPPYDMTTDLDFSHRLGATVPTCCGRGYDDGAWCRP